ncbi:MAG: glycosyltransferase family 2 protein [bacterium]|nr:glycosyltransferase family 2 protein [bacterium]MDO8742396.1 glycosyltransferase family 2 protein [bacterium]
MHTISIIIPVYNEEGSVAALHAELVAVLTKLSVPFEIIFVDDGSMDQTLRVLKTLRPARIISFARNFGKSQALQAGFHAAKGEYIFTMDGDLQDDPNEISHFIERMEQDRADLVCGWKKQRLDDPIKRLVSKVANALTRFSTGTSVHDMNCGFKLYRKEVAKTLSLYGDMHRYIPAIAAAHGFRISEVAVHHRKREFGVSKYGNFRRFFKSFFDFITLLLVRRFIDRPMHFFGIIGSLSAMGGLAILSYLFYIKLFEGAAIGNRPLLLLGVLLVVIGMQLFSSGFLGELIIRQNGSRNMYTVREVIEIV